MQSTLEPIAADNRSLPDTIHRILVIHETLPQPDRSGCDSRLMQVLREFRHLGHSVVLVARHAPAGASLDELRSLGIQVYANDLERIAASQHPDWHFRDVLAEGEFTVAFVFQWYWWGVSVGEDYIDEIRRYSPRTLVALLSDDRHALRERRLAAITKKPIDLLKAENIERRELEVLEAVDLIAGVSETDLEWFRDNSSAPCCLLPIAAEQHPSPAKYEERTGVLFLGDFSNRANVEGIDWFLQSVWPRCRELAPGITLRLIGNALAPGSIAADGIEVVGYAPDLDVHFQHSKVFISPIRYCTGIQTKSLAAISRGLPVVTTAAAAEGLGLWEATGAIIGNDPESFAEAVAALHSNRTLWQRVSTAGVEYAKYAFSQEALRHSVARMLVSLSAIKPKGWQNEHVFSMRRVEAEYPESIAPNSTPLLRVSTRIRAHLDLAESFLFNDDKEAARNELLHLFAFTNGSVMNAGLYSRAFLLLAGMGSHDSRIATARCVQAAADVLNESVSKESVTNAPAGLSHSESDPSRVPEISVVIPTHDRAPVLANCLAELLRQSVAPDRFEVIVIDDGSRDQTRQFCQSLKMPFPLRYHRQEHTGAGSARNRGALLSRGKYLLFMNDDSIAAPNLLEEHLKAQQSLPKEKCWVLGWFGYSSAARRRALTHFFSTQPFLFPQSQMTKGLYHGAPYFITCNASIRRTDLIAAGSFDPTFSVAEDTELGARLDTLGYGALYWPNATAMHDHLQFRADSLVSRARQYGEPTLRLLIKHPRMLAGGKTPFGLLDKNWIEQTRTFVTNSKPEADKALEALRQFDGINLSALFTSGGKEIATEIENVIKIAATKLHWFYLFESMLQKIDAKSTWRAAELAHR